MNVETAKSAGRIAAGLSDAQYTNQMQQIAHVDAIVKEGYTLATDSILASIAKAPTSKTEYS